MFDTLFAKIGAVLAVPGIILGGLFIDEEKELLKKQLTVMEEKFLTLQIEIAKLPEMADVWNAIQAEPPSQPPLLGAALPQGPAVFETSLQSRISSSDTSMTLVANSVRGGSTLSGWNCFTLDEGRTDMEYACGTVSGTSVTGMTRGIDPVTGTTSNSALKFSHRVGANIKITDFPLLQILKAQNAGEDTFPNLLSYASGTECTGGSASTSICSKQYVDDVVNQGAATSTETVGGIVELGTLAEQANSTDNGANQPTVLQTKNSTSTCQVVGSYNIVASSTTGKLDKNCFDQTAQYAFTATTTFATTTMASTSVSYSLTVGATTTTQDLVILGSVSGLSTSTTFTATSTWTKPQNAKKVFVQLWGAGGSGGTGQDGNSADAGGGGGGEYSEWWFEGSALPSSGTVTIGRGGVAKTGNQQAGEDGGATNFLGMATSSGGAAGQGGTDGQAGGSSGGPADVTGLWGIAAGGAAGTYGLYSGAGGGALSTNGLAGGGSRYGGGGGGGADDDSAGGGGTSQYGGAGGAGSSNGNGTAGSAPGGGGGATDHGSFISGSGANGRATVTVFF